MRKNFLPTALRIVLLVSSVGGSAYAEAPPTAEAQSHFKAGVEFLKAQRYDEAYRELKAAHAISPRPMLLGNLGIAADELERDGEAVDAYEGYLAGVRLNGQEETRVRRGLARLRAGMAAVTLEAPGQFWVIDTRSDAGANVVNEYGPFEEKAELRLRGGQHELQLARASFTAAPWHVTLDPGNAASHSFEKNTEPAPPIIETFGPEQAEATPVELDAPATSHTTSYVLWGVGAVGAIATTVFWLEANSAQKEADDEYAQRCPFGAVTEDCGAATRGDEKAASLRTATLVTGIGALGAAVGGTIFYLLDERSASPDGTATEASIRPWLSPTGIGVSGAF